MSDMVERIAHAVLYEGYLLYPYRHSAIKNRHRFNFGVLYPPAWATAQTGSDRSYLRLECIARAAPEAAIHLSARFLQLLTRRREAQSWQEGVEQRFTLPPLSLAELLAGFTASQTFTAGDNPLEARLHASATPIVNDHYHLSVHLHNTTVSSPASAREAALLHSLASAHLVLHIEGGRFASLTDPPDDLRAPSAACQNTGVWPVLIGDAAPARLSSDTILGTPIILSDFPQIAPESSGDLFDATEIDEILTLRVLTLTDSEKQELRLSDPHARQLLERLETAPTEHLLQLHGALRGRQQEQRAAWSSWDTIDAKPVETTLVNGVEVKKGDRVRLRPRGRADIFDTVLQGRTGIVEAVEQDFENRVQLAIILDDDPGRDLGELRQAGHRFFFFAEEVEPLAPERTAL